MTSHTPASACNNWGLIFSKNHHPPQEVVMTVHKHPIHTHLVRAIPEQFSWVDHRLVQQRYIDHLSHQAAALYLFLVTVSDHQGLSYYSDTTLGKRLTMDSAVLTQARETLIRHHLIAYQCPLYQVLALDCRSTAAPADQEISSVGQILQQLGGGAR
jgi:hypothetical protein